MTSIHVDSDVFYPLRLAVAELDKFIGLTYDQDAGEPMIAQWRYDEGISDLNAHIAYEAQVLLEELPKGIQV